MGQHEDEQAAQLAAQVKMITREIHDAQQYVQELSGLRGVFLRRMAEELKLTQREIAAATDLTQPRVGQILGIQFPAKGAAVDASEPAGQSGVANAPSNASASA